jgi:hypothetical protein
LGNPIGIKRLERVVLFTDADKLYRLARYLFDRKRCAASRIAVHLG